MTKCLFEVGKKYKTRIGLDAVIYAIYPIQGHPIHGAIYSPDTKYWSSYTWELDGKTGGRSSSHYSLVPPVYEGWAWLYRGDLTKNMNNEARDHMLTSLGFVKIKVREVTDE